MWVFILFSTAVVFPMLGTCACQAVIVGVGGWREERKRWEAGIVGQTVVAFGKTPAALVLPFLTRKGIVISSAERFFF